MSIHIEQETISSIRVFIYAAIELLKVVVILANVAVALCLGKVVVGLEKVAGKSRRWSRKTLNTRNIRFLNL